MSNRHAQIRSTMLQLEGQSPRSSSKSPRRSPRKSPGHTPLLPVVAYSWPQMEATPAENTSARDAFCSPISTWSLQKRVIVFFVLWAIVGTSIGLAVYFSNKHAAVEAAERSSTDESNNGLDEHNDFRALFDAPALSWNETLASDAAEWAANCKFEHAGKNSHGEGENLCLGAQTINGCIGLWEDEESMYNYSAPGFTHDTGHFTQMIWAATTQLGCALAACDGSPLTVCRYYPAGNVVNDGMFEENVHQREDDDEPSSASSPESDGQGNGHGRSASSTAHSGYEKTSKTTSTAGTPEIKTSDTSTTMKTSTSTASADHTSSTSDAKESENAINGLDKHNTFRAAFDTDALSWNKSLASDAASWAANCKFEHAGEQSHGEGENLCSGATTINSCIDMWEDEEKNYDYSSPGFTEETGHFTQMLWASTTSLGCALSPCDGTPITVCRYYPAGNVVNEGFFEKNVHERA